MAVGTIVFQIFPAQILSIFNVSDSIVAIGIPAFRTISTCFIFAAISIILSTLFQAMGDAYLSMIGSFTRQIIIILPAALILSRLYGLNQTWLAFPISEFITVSLAFIFFMIQYNKKIKNLVPIDKNQN